MESFDVKTLQPITLADKESFTKSFVTKNRPSCECNFVNLFSWSSKYDFSWAHYKDNLIVFCALEQQILMPLGNHLAPQELLNLSCSFRDNNLGDGTIYDVPFDYLNNFPECSDLFKIETFESDYDYIYATEKLCTLSGPKLRKKRNLVKQFTNQYPAFYCKKLDEQNKLDAYQAIKLINQEMAQSRFLEEENSALEQAFLNYSSLDLKGIILYAKDSEIAGVSIFSPLDTQIYDIHFEKANHNYKGASQVLTWQVAKTLQHKCKYLNREQDLGLLGLRKAKKSLDPAFIYKRYSLTPKQ